MLHWWLCARNLPEKGSEGKVALLAVLCVWRQPLSSVRDWPAQPESWTFVIGHPEQLRCVCREELFHVWFDLLQGAAR